MNFAFFFVRSVCPFWISMIMECLPLSHFPKWRRRKRRTIVPPITLICIRVTYMAFQNKQPEQPGGGAFDSSQVEQKLQYTKRARTSRPHTLQMYYAMWCIYRIVFSSFFQYFATGKPAPANRFKANAFFKCHMTLARILQFAQYYNGASDGTRNGRVQNEESEKEWEREREKQKMR